MNVGQIRKRLEHYPDDVEVRCMSGRGRLLEINVVLDELLGLGGGSDQAVVVFA